MRTLIALLFTLSLAAAQNKPVSNWKYELPEDVTRIAPVGGGSHLFVQADEYVWLYENATGRKVWGAVIDDHSPKAPQELLNDSLFVAGDGDTLFCWNIRRNAVVWKKRYAEIDQTDFSGRTLCDSILVLSYGETDLAVALTDGKELWRAPMEYNADLKKADAAAVLLFEPLSRHIAFTAADEVRIVNTLNGKALFTRKKSEPAMDLVRQQRRWTHVSDDGRTAVLLLDGGVLVLDVAAAKEKSYIPMDFDAKLNALLPSPAGCFVVGAEKTVHIPFGNARTGEVTVDGDDIYSITVIPTDSSSVALISTENRMTGLDLSSGAVLWRSAEKAPTARGFVRSLVSSSDTMAVLTVLDPSDDLQLFLVGLSPRTGAVRYRTLVAHADESMPERTLPLLANSGGQFFGHDQAGFRYTLTAADGKAHLLIHTASDMIEPGTDRDGGEGYVIADLATGRIEKKVFMKIAQDLSYKGGFDGLAAPLTVGSVKILPGHRKLVAIDTAAASLAWMLIEQDLKDGAVTDMALADTLLLLRTGGIKRDYTYDEKKKKTESKIAWDEDDAALIAVDVRTGRVVWSRELDEHPGLLFPSYSMSRFMVNGSGLLYATRKFLHLQAVQPKKADSLRWSFEFADSGVGTYDLGELFVPASFWTKEPPGNGRFTQDPNILFTTAAVAGEPYGSGVSRVLQVNWDPEAGTLILIGEDGVASVDPATGRKRWLREWSYSDDAVSYRPLFLRDQLFSFVKGSAELVSLKTGKLTYGIRTDAESGVFVMPDASAVIFVHKDEISALVVPQ